MKQTIVLIITALVLATPARAVDDSMAASGVAVTMAYDEFCTPLPMSMKRDAMEVVATLPASIVKAEMVKVVDLLKDIGAAKFCAAMKPRIDAAR